GPRIAGRERDAATDDRVRAERTRLHPLQVHRAAAALAEAVRETEDLGEGASQRDVQVLAHELLEVEARAHVGDDLREELVVATVRAVDPVARAEREDRADRAALLPDARVGRAVDETL